MAKTFAHFLASVHHYPQDFTNAQLGGLLDDRSIAALKDVGILKRGSDLKEIPCRSCDDGHFVPVRMDQGGEPYCFCSRSDSKRQYLDPSEVCVWSFDVETFLQTLVSKLGIEDEVEGLETEGLWQVGSFSRDDTRHVCYYHQGGNVEGALAFIARLPSQMRRYILFSHHKPDRTPNLSDHALLPVDLGDILALKGKTLFCDKGFFDDSLIYGFRRMVFDRKNGDLSVDGRRIVTVTPTTPEYYFVDLLWKKFKEPVAHQAMERHIYAKTGKEYMDTAEKLAHKQKNKVKKASNDTNLIDRIFVATKDENGKSAYMMRDPS